MTAPGLPAMKTISDAWAEFEMFVCTGAPHPVRDAMRFAFYSGTASILAGLNSVTDEGSSVETVTAWLSCLNDELRQYGAGAEVQIPHPPSKDAH